MKFVLGIIAAFVAFVSAAHAEASTVRDVVLELVERHAPPGNTAFSVAPAADCKATDTACEGARWSDFYSTWVRKETPELGSQRYAGIIDALVQEARGLLCRDLDGKPVDGCTPYSGALTSKGRRRWDVLTLSVAGATVAMLESGYREDVMVGRGAAKTPSADGGRGRGPGLEGCLVQIHPTVAWRFADVPDADLKKRAEAGNADAREAVIKSLLGSDEAALGNCWRTGLRMLVHARAYCAWAAPKAEWDFAMFALYGTGTSCTSINEGKTTKRTRLFRAMLGEARAKYKRPVALAGG